MLIMFLFEGANTCFLLVSVKFAAVAYNKIFEKSKIAANMADVL